MPVLFYTFKCESCGGEKDQKVRRRVDYITCLCGGRAARMSEGKDAPADDKLWWDGGKPPIRPAIVPGSGSIGRRTRRGLLARLLGGS